MSFNWKATLAGVAVTLFAVACSDVTPPTKSPGVRSNTITIIGGTQVDYSGNGFTNGVLNSSFCLSPQGGGPGVPAPPLPNTPYLLWVLTANGATAAQLHLPDGDHDMVNVGGTFKYISGYFAANDLIGVAFAVYSGTVSGKVKLTVSHGCDGGTDHPQGSSIVTEVHLAGTHAVVSTSSPAALGSSVHDQATVTTDGNVTIPDGSQVHFYFWRNGTCDGTTFEGPEDDALIGSSPGVYDGGLPKGPLGAGAYSYKALFTSGDKTTVSDSEGECEPLAISKGELHISTEVHNASHSDITNTSVDLGSVIHDYALVSGAVSGYTPANSVTFKRFANLACTGDGTSVDSDGAEGSGVKSVGSALGAGSYGYEASLAGDANYTVVDDTGCEPVTVKKGTLHISTKVHNASHVDITNTSVAAGSIIHDFAAVTGAVSGFAPANSVTFRFFANGACTGEGSSATNAGAEGTGVRSVNSAALTPGFYGYTASLAGDDNYNVTDDTGCEPVTLVALGKTMGFWGNANGILAIGNYSTHAVAIGRGSNIDSKDESLKVLPSTLNACGKASITIFTGQNSSTNCSLATGINIGTLNTNSAQTLALGYNIMLVTNYTGQTIGLLGCSAYVNAGLLATNTVQDAFAKAVTLINGSVSGGTTTQAQLGAMNLLLNCLNRET